MTMAKKSLIDFLSNMGFIIKAKKSTPYKDFKYKFDEPSSQSKESNSAYGEFISSKFKKYDKGKIDALIHRRINRIVSHFEELLQEQSNEVECVPPKNFKGPFLPSINQLNALSQLDIDVSWQLSEVHSDLKGNKSKNYRTGKFSSKETKKLVKRWRKFKRKYDFHDLRPLVGEKTCVVTKDNGEVFFYSISYLNSEQKRNFLLYMGKKLPDRVLDHIWNHIKLKLHLFALEGETSDDGPKKRTSKELNIITAFIRNYGFNAHGLNVVLKKRTFRQINDIISYYHKIVHIPMKIGPWSLEEKLGVIKAVMLQFPGMNLETILKEKRSISWELVFQQIQNRPKLNIAYVWYDMKQCLYTALRPETEDPSWKHHNVLRLLKLVSESNAESINHIDWSSLAQHFPFYVDTQLKKVFLHLYKKKIPNDVEDFASGANILYKAALFLEGDFEVKFMKKVMKRAEAFKPLLPSLKDSLLKQTTRAERSLRAKRRAHKANSSKVTYIKAKYLAGNKKLLENPVLAQQSASHNPSLRHKLRSLTGRTEPVLGKYHKEIMQDEASHAVEEHMKTHAEEFRAVSPEFEYFVQTLSQTQLSNERTEARNDLNNSHANAASLPLIHKALAGKKKLENPVLAQQSACHNPPLRYKLRSLIGRRKPVLGNDPKENMQDEISHAVEKHMMTHAEEFRSVSPEFEYSVQPVTHTRLYSKKIGAQNCLNNSYPNETSLQLSHKRAMVELPVSNLDYIYSKKIKLETKSKKVF